MKYSELKRLLRKNGCRMDHEGGNHKYGIRRLPETCFLLVDMIQKRLNQTHWLLLEDRLAFNY